jgi:hypothetical protein
MHDTKLFDFLMMLLKLILQKTYQSFDLGKVFGIAFDNQPDNSRTSFIEKSNLSRYVITKPLDWKKIRGTPQYIAKSY